MLRSIETRLARIERARASRDPAELPRATVLYLASDEAAAPRLADLASRGEHRRGRPILAIRADWRAVRAMEGTRP